MKLNNFRNLIIVWISQSGKFPLEYEIKVEKLKRRNWFTCIKGQTWEWAKLRVVRNIEWTINSEIANFWSQTLIFQIKKISKFLNFPISAIPETSNLKNSENLQFDKLKKNSIWKLPKIFISENFKNCRFEKFQTCLICEIPQICNLEN